jgi:hypothetical protein
LETDQLVQSGLKAREGGLEPVHFVFLPILTPGPCGKAAPEVSLKI